MASDFPSVDDFVAAYLANCDPTPVLAHQPASLVGLGANGLPVGALNGLQHVQQQAVNPLQQQCQQAGGAQLQATPAVGGGVGQQAKWQQGPGDVYMQPLDQTVQQLGMQQFQQASWQQQQQLLQQQHQQLMQQQQLAAQQQQHAASVTVPAAATAAGLQQAAAPGSSTAAAAHGGNSSRPPPQQQQQQGASSTTTGKRSSRTKSSTTRGRKSKQEQQQQLEEAEAAAQQVLVKAEVDAAFIAQNLTHSLGAPPLLHDPAAAAAAGPQFGMANSFSAFGQAGNLASVLMLQQQMQGKQQAAAAQAAAVQMQPGTSTAQAEDDEPDMSHLTVMQRYHARRKLAVQRMEREVEEKIAQLAVLEQENRQLKWQAHILENMLLDMDKQVELMSAEELPDASQWLTLLGMGTSAAAGGGGGITRTLHKMLEGASTTDISGWSVQDCRRRWLDYLEQLRPLVQEAEAAQAAFRAAQGSSCEQLDSAAAQQQQPQRRPRRAAAQAAVAVIKQEAADVLGVAPLPVCPITGTIPDVPAPASLQQQQHASHSGSPAVSAAAPGGEATGGSAQPMEGVQQGGAANSSLPAASDTHSVGSMTGSELSHGPNVEGVPAALLARIEDLVLRNFYWLLAIMTRNPVLTYEFISLDLVEGRTPLPPQQDAIWGAAVERVEMTLEQQQECCTCLQVSRRCMAKVIEERAEITAAMDPCVHNLQTGPTSQAWMSNDMLNQNQAEGTVDRMRANVRKESVVRNLVGFYCINVISLYQLARLSVACSPWFCMAWRVAGAAEEKLNRQLAGEAALQQQAAAGRHNTRSSARLAATQR